jgi:Lar family restriction alleviation protein
VDKFNLIYGESEKRTLEASLLPCPFCGEDASISGMFPQGQFYVTCGGCRVSLWHDRKDKAIANWNARVKNSDNYLQAAPTQSN